MSSADSSNRGGFIPSRFVRRPVWLVLTLLVSAVMALASGCQNAATAPRAAESAKPTQRSTNQVSCSDADRERIAQSGTWAPGQLEAHFQKHGREGPYASQADYDRAARETVRNGKCFTYVDRESRATRLGAYHPPTNRFTAVTNDGRRITTFFHPDRGEAYVRGLDRSTYQ